MYVEIATRPANSISNRERDDFAGKLASGSQPPEMAYGWAEKISTVCDRV
jgi:hypothetical protein